MRAGQPHSLAPHPNRPLIPIATLLVRTLPLLRHARCRNCVAALWPESFLSAVVFLSLAPLVDHALARALSRSFCGRARLAAGGPRRQVLKGCSDRQSRERALELGSPSTMPASVAWCQRPFIGGCQHKTSSSIGNARASPIRNQPVRPLWNAFGALRSCVRQRPSPAPRNTHIKTYPNICHSDLRICVASWLLKDARRRPKAVDDKQRHTIRSHSA